MQIKSALGANLRIGAKVERDLTQLCTSIEHFLEVNDHVSALHWSIVVRGARRTSGVKGCERYTCGCVRGSCVGV